MVANVRRIEELMAIKGLTAHKLAGLSGCGDATISRMVNGHVVSAKTLHKIALALGVDVQELFYDDPCKVHVMLGEGAKMPTRAHSTDAGLDLYSPVEAVIYPGESVTIDTKVHLAVPKGYVGMVKSKSGLNVRHSVTSEGVIDAGYTGSIAVKMYNHGNVIFKVEKGMKISQLVLLPIITPNLVEVGSLEQTERGAGGFGSTGLF